MKQRLMQAMGEDSRAAANGRLLASIAVGLALLLVVRLPFISNVLIDEEGSLAYLVLGTRPVMQGELSLLIGRIDGVDVLAAGGRTPMPYLFIDRVMRPLFGPGDVDGWSIPAISRVSRLPFLAVFMIGCGILAAFAALVCAKLDLPTRAACLLALAYAMSTPIVGGGSIQPQLDGAIGVLVVALGGTLIAGGAGPAGRRRSHAVSSADW